MVSMQLALALHQGQQLQLQLALACLLSFGGTGGGTASRLLSGSRLLLSVYLVLRGSRCLGGLRLRLRRLFLHLFGLLLLKH